jgi:uncharacterized protein YbaP (TraB family)
MRRRNKATPQPLANRGILRAMLRRLMHAFCWLLALGTPLVVAAPCPPPPVLPTAAQLQAAQAQDRGLLWRLQRDGRTSYLYGTLHVGRPEWMLPGPRVAAALAGSPVLALEIDPADAASQGELAAGDKAAAQLPPALQARLARQVAAACLPEGALDSLAPAMQAVVLSVLEARWAGLDPAYAQELALTLNARAAGHRVVALETVAQQMQLLVPGQAQAAQAMVEQALAQLESGTARSTIGRLARAWETGDLAALEAYTSWCDCVHDDKDRAALRALNDERNPALAAGIDALHRQGGPVFAAVGALHMTGPAALPRLLAARGFTVERVVLAP